MVKRIGIVIDSWGKDAFKGHLSFVDAKLSQNCNGCIVVTLDESKYEFTFDIKSQAVIVTSDMKEEQTYKIIMGLQLIGFKDAHIV